MSGSVAATSLAVSRTYAADAERVFAAWTTVEALTKWFGPKQIIVPRATIDLRVGGAHEIVMQSEHGESYIHRGHYREIDPPRRLVFTWLLENQDCEGSDGVTAETVVSIDFEATPAGTKVTLQHDGLPSEPSCTAHTHGWTDSLECLMRHLSN